MENDTDPIPPAPREKHPDLFTPEEAITYLNLEEVGQLNFLRESRGLKGYRLGKTYQYHRRDLDALVDEIFGIPKVRK
jgi:hypothetical protein